MVLRCLVEQLRQRFITTIVVTIVVIIIDSRTFRSLEIGP